MSKYYSFSNLSYCSGMFHGLENVFNMFYRVTNNSDHYIPYFGEVEEIEELLEEIVILKDKTNLTIEFSILNSCKNLKKCNDQILKNQRAGFDDVDHLLELYFSQNKYSKGTLINTKKMKMDNLFIKFDKCEKLT
ncbi:hypothetical protein OAC15_04010 [Alphaproteobacteria bacterium]|nr:hypothetical protein [Alphaproteobacteria bacterium]